MRARDVALTIIIAGLLLATGWVAAHADHVHDAHWDTWPVTIDRLAGHDVDAAADWWNVAAGHPIFEPVAEGGQIQTVTSSSTYVVHDDGLCQVHLSDDVDTVTLIHELGHCIGFEDHTPTGTDPRNGRQNLGTCDLYRGIMSYCPWPPVPADDDLRAVRRITGAEYRRIVAIVNADGWPDAVAATSLNADVLYVHVDSIPDDTAEQLHLYDRAVIVGGEASVSYDVEVELGRFVERVTRISGPDRVSTAAALARINEVLDLDLR